MHLAAVLVHLDRFPDQRRRLLRVACEHAELQRVSGYDASTIPTRCHDAALPILVSRTLPAARRLDGGDLQVNRKLDFETDCRG